MLNIVTLVGIIVEDPILKEFESGTKGTFLTLRIAKPFRSMDRNYESEFIRCVLWEGIAQSTCEYCVKGDVVGIRGRIATRTQEVVFNCENTQHKKKINTIEIIGERVSFISTSKKSRILERETMDFDKEKEEEIS